MASKRAKTAIAAIVALAAAGGGYVTMSSGDRVPDDVALAATYLVSPWEGRELRAYPDPATGGAPWTICDGDTVGVKRGMVETPAGCDRRLSRRMMQFRGELVACIPNFAAKPLSWRAMMNSLSYNIGTGATCRSTAARLGNARGMTFRPRGDMVAISTSQAFGLSTTSIQLDTVLDAYDPAKHSSAPKLVIGATVYTPSVTVVTPDLVNPKKRRVLANFTVPATTEARARFDMTSTEVTDVPFIENIALYAL
ncbi:MAG: hypothetical protein QHC89_01820 [Bosea sp. (in: a-proteobacteria)]|nr:hypothetical protein [Bosea sp. (in: a-proteobacteria)]